MANDSIKRSRSRDQLCCDLDVSPETLKRQPSLSKQLAGVRDLLKKSDKTAGLPVNPLACLTLSQEQDAHDLLRLASDYHLDSRRIADMDVLCAKTGIPTSRVTEMITKVCVRAGMKASALVASLRHAEVVQKTVEYAMEKDGVQDRMMLHRATGFLPTPKGSKTVINVSTGMPFEADGDRKKVRVAPPEDTIRKLVGRFQKESAALPPPDAEDEASPDDPVEAEIVEEEEEEAEEGEWRN